MIAAAQSERPVTAAGSDKPVKTYQCRLQNNANA